MSVVTLLELPLGFHGQLISILFQRPDPCATAQKFYRGTVLHTTATQFFTSARLKAILLSLVEQISSSSAEIHNLWTSIAILLALATLFAVESI